MKEYVKTRCDLLADYIIRNRSTVRDTAAVFGVSKSTVHKDVTQRLSEFDLNKAKKVSEVLSFNLSERHLRGGNATKQKYLTIKEEKRAKEKTNAAVPRNRVR